VKGRRGLTTAVLLCLLGASVVLVAAGRAWAVVEVAAGPISEAGTVAHTGTDLVPGVTALGLLGLAGVVALAATRRTGRTLVGVVLMAAGAGVVFAVFGALGTVVAEELPGQTGADTVDLTAWWPLTAVGGLLLLAAGLVTVVGGRSWPALGQRYEAPAAAAAPTGQPEALTEKGLWEALDRGEDPTANLGTLAGPPADREADRT
jgi:uncharacterized membrane protein (TIGR02234 family)